MESTFFTVLYGMISIIPVLLTFIACCYYISKSTKVDAVLLFIGSAVSLAINIFYSAVIPFLFQASNVTAAEATIYYKITGVIGFFGGICFAVGLFMLVNNVISAIKINRNQLPNGNF